MRKSEMLAVRSRFSDYFTFSINTNDTTGKLHYITYYCWEFEDYVYNAYFYATKAQMEKYI